MGLIQNLPRTKLIAIITLLIIVVAIPLTVYIAQKRQEVRQHASGKDILTYFTNCTDNSQLNQLPISGPFSLCLYIQTESSSPPSLVAFDIQMNFGTSLNLNKITVEDGGNQFNLSSINTFNNTNHTFELARANGNPSAVNINGTLFIAKLDFAPTANTGSGEIDFTNAQQSITGLNAGNPAYLSVEYNPLAYTIGQGTTTTPSVNPLDVNNDGCIGIGDIKAWEHAYENSGHKCDNTNSPDVNNGGKGDGSIDLLDYNAIFAHMLSGASDLCTNNQVPNTCPYKQQ